MAITNFIPEVWSAAILEALRAKLVFPSLCNRDYEATSVRPVTPCTSPDTTT